jgi:hypothetical protein
MIKMEIELRRMDLIYLFPDEDPIKETDVYYDQYNYKDQIIAYAITREVEDGRQIYIFWNNSFIETSSVVTEIPETLQIRYNIELLTSIKEKLSSFKHIKAGTTIREYTYKILSGINEWNSITEEIPKVTSFFIQSNEIDDNLGYIIIKITKSGPLSMVDYYIFIDKKYSNPDTLPQITKILKRKYQKIKQHTLVRLCLYKSLDTPYII